MNTTHTPARDPEFAKMLDSDLRNAIMVHFLGRADSYTKIILFSRMPGMNQEVLEALRNRQSHHEARFIAAVAELQYRKESMR